jgi:hypothetical protein
MTIIYVPDTVKFMTKQARNIADGIYDIIKEHQRELCIDITVLESAARKCTVAKYLAIAKQWVKVPKKKPYHEWASSLRNFDEFFERAESGQKGLSSIYCNRDDAPLVWTTQLIDRYMLCSGKLLCDWTSYADMDTIVAWCQYDIITINTAFNVAEKRGALSIPYINAILERDQSLIDHKYNKEIDMVDKHGGMPVYRKSRTIFDVLKEMEIAEQAKIDYENEQRKKAFDKIFKEESDNQ